MSTVVKSTGADFKPCPEGTHVARCVQLIVLGMIHSEKWDKKSEQVLLGWEVPSELRDDGAPHLLWQRYTMSLHEKAKLRQHLEAWRGKKFTDEELAGFDLKNILGKPCMISVVHNSHDGRTYANIQTVMSMLKGSACPKQISKTVFYDVDDHDAEVFDTFGERLQADIISSDNWRAYQERLGRKPTKAADEAGAYDIPEDDGSIPF